MDETRTEQAFWAVVNEVDRAEAHDEPLSADVPRMLHKRSSMRTCSIY